MYLALVTAVTLYENLMKTNDRFYEWFYENNTLKYRVDEGPSSHRSHTWDDNRNKNSNVPINNSQNFPVHAQQNHLAPPRTYNSNQEFGSSNHMSNGQNDFLSPNLLRAIQSAVQNCLAISVERMVKEKVDLMK